MNRRKGTLCLLLLLLIGTAHAQVIFTYGPRSVTKQEFLKAYNKNNIEETATDKAYREYLDLYIRFKLKVQAALDKKLDTLPSQIAELRAFRSQVVESYLKDDESLNALIDEAIDRSAKDIHVAHIYVAIPQNAQDADIKKARQKIDSAYALLKKGVDFSKVAMQYSEDPAVKTNKGDIGYITVFSLPYEMESAAWALAPGKYSAPFHTKGGYHIFKKIDERKAAGRIRAAQILLAFMPGATDEQKQERKQLADSIYQALQGGANFEALVDKYSGDNISLQSHGEMPAFGVGEYDPVFENAAFALTRDGEISKPVLTEFGYHIIKRLERLPPRTNRQDSALREEMKQKIYSDKRLDVAKKALVKKIAAKTGYKRHAVSEAHLSAFTDSILQKKEAPRFKDFSPETPLLTFPHKTYRVKDWQTYLETVRDFENLREGRTNEELFDHYLETAALDYYREHLEEYNPDFAYQLNEFREGNLLFEIMQRHIWDAAAADSAGLQKYYQAHKNNYWWEPSADVILFTASNEKAADDARKKMKTNYKDWTKYIDSSSGMLQGDSGRFELGQIPVRERTNFTNGLITANVKNETDNSITFAYIVKVYMQREPRSFDDARGFVINDYQTQMEEDWIAELKKKYPVKVNEEVVRSLPKNRKE